MNSVAANKLLNLNYKIQFLNWHILAIRRYCQILVVVNMGGTQSLLQRIRGKKKSTSEYPPSDKPVFGVSLSEAERSAKHADVPKIVVECVEYIEKPDIIVKKGIYRVSGVKSKIDDLKRLVMRKAIPTQTAFIIMTDSNPHSPDPYRRQLQRNT